MRLLVKIYKQNIYGVIGTLIFHILLFSAFLLADVDIKGNVKEEALLIEFPELPLIPEEEITAEEEDSQQNSAEEIVNNNRTNIASNRLSRENTTTSTDDFFDKEYLEELEAARKLASDVRSQLSKEVVDIKDIKMPVQSTKGMNPDSIKNVVYVGESNIVYYLENRYHIDLHVPIYLAAGGGLVVVDIAVNRQGRVVEAEPRKNKNIRDEQVFVYAKAAALRTTFNSDANAPDVQNGTIHYTFIAQ